MKKKLKSVRAIRARHATPHTPILPPQAETSWKPEVPRISRVEMRAIVAEMIG